MKKIKQKKENKKQKKKQKKQQKNKTKKESNVAEVSPKPAYYRDNSRQEHRWDSLYFTISCLQNRLLNNVHNSL